MTIELRCRHNKKAAEFDADTLSFLIPCATCTDVWGRKVSHRWPVADLLKIVGEGKVGGVVHPAEVIGLEEADVEAPVR